MPIYEFECRKCKAYLEVFQKVSDKPPVKCRKCGGRLEKLISAPAIQFKGAGWYVTDYAGKGKAAKTEEHSESSSSSSEKSINKETSPSKKTTDSASSKRAPKSD